MAITDEAPNVKPVEAIHQRLNEPPVGPYDGVVGVLPALVLQSHGGQPLVRQQPFC